MTDIFLGLLTIIFGAVTLWLRHIGKPQVEKYNFDASLLPHQSVSDFREQQTSLLKLFAQKVNGLLKKLLPTFILIGEFIMLVIAIYFAVKNSASDNFPIILIGISNLLLAFSIIWLLFNKAGLPQSSDDVLFSRSYDDENHQSYKRVRYNGTGKIPKKVYEGDSKNISIELHPHMGMVQDQENPVVIQDLNKRDKMIILNFLQNIGSQEYLEIEILAAGFAIEGDKKQKQLLTATPLRYQWNCYFPNSGNHTLALVIRVGTSSQAIELGFIEHAIKVAKLGNLTQRQVWTLATFTGITSGILAFAEALHRLGVW